MAGEGAGAALRAAARRVDDVAAQVRVAARAATSAQAARWESVAAEELRTRLAEEAARLRAVAEVVDAAGGALLRHAGAVDAATW